MTQPSYNHTHHTKKAKARPGRWLATWLATWPHLALLSTALRSPKSTHYMGFLHALLNQPSRSYSTPEPEAALPTTESGQHERAARKAQYYSSATDPNIRREWDRILQSDSARARATPSPRAGVRSTPILPLRHQVPVVSTKYYSSCRTAYDQLTSAPARPCTGN